jgi:hypothetical protein
MTTQPVIAVKEPSAHVRRYVKDLLERAPAYQALAPGDKRALAQDLVKVMGFLSQTGGPLPGEPVLAAAQADSPTTSTSSTDTTGIVSDVQQKQKLVGSDFKASAATAAASTFKTLVEAVDFPKFVSGLIEGVYTSIVQSTIKQMKEFQRFIEAVSKSVDQFAKDHITQGQASNFLQSAFPSALQTDDSSGQLKYADGLDDADKPDLKSYLNMKDDADLEDEDGQQKILYAAQLKMAAQRQHQLTTMLLMGLQRIVVTDGEIKASVQFDVKGKDFAQRDSYTSAYDARTQSDSDSSFWGTSSNVDTKVSTSFADVKDKSTAEVEAKAKLAGSVTVRFKSETFPLEKLAPSSDIDILQAKAGG